MRQGYFWGWETDFTDLAGLPGSLPTDCADFTDGAYYGLREFPLNYGLNGVNGLNGFLFYHEFHELLSRKSAVFIPVNLREKDHVDHGDHSSIIKNHNNQRHQRSIYLTT